MATTKRKAVSASLRFAVFKRDSFRCQYCGKSAPDVLLHLDHIKPVVDGGDNDITNLVAACSDCNLGKGREPLSDNAAVSKAKRQLDELSERREQIEMMMRWREGLLDIGKETVEMLAGYWYRLAPGRVLNEKGMAILSKLSRRFSVNEITEAMETAASQYLKIETGSEPTQESWGNAFVKVGAICTVKRACQGDEQKEELYCIRGYVRARIPGYFNMKLAMDGLEAAVSWGVTAGEIRSACRDCTSWTKFHNAISRLILEAQERETPNA